MSNLLELPLPMVIVVVTQSRNGTVVVEDVKKPTKQTNEVSIVNSHN